MFKVISLHGVVFIYLIYTRVTFSCFLPLKDLNPSLFYLNLPYLSLPIFPLVLHRRESFLVRLTRLINSIVRVF